MSRHPGAPGSQHGSQSRCGEEFLYVGSYTATSGGRGNGISRVVRSRRTGLLDEPTLVAELASPTFLAWHPALPVLYATSEHAHTLSAFAARHDGTLGAIGELPAGGEVPCHVTVHPSGHALYVASYRDGSFAVYAIDDKGRPDGPKQVVRHRGSGPEASRQLEPHVHSTVVSHDQRRLLVADLGADAVYCYELDAAGRLVDDGSSSQLCRAPAGSGPRHLVQDPVLQSVFVACELNSTIAVLSFVDGVLGRLQQSVPATAKLSETRNYPSEIAFGEGGRHLYLANRGADVVSVFAVTPTALVPLAEVATEGAFPRHLLIRDRFLYVANQLSDTIGCFEIDSLTGIPRALFPQLPLASPAVLVGDRSARLGIDSL